MGRPREFEIDAVLEQAMQVVWAKGAEDIGALARFITAGIQGVRLVRKANPDRAVLKDIAAVILRCLDAPPVRQK